MTPTDAASFDPVSWMKQWAAAMKLAPSTLVQPILPGWTFNVNSFNSSAPQTEADVLEQHSYGRQLGRIGDALAALVKDLPETGEGKPFEKFLEMKAQIDAIKAGNAQERVRRLMADLDLLKVLRPEEHKRLKAELDKQLARRAR
jgi:hypothetical protein